MFCKGLKQLVCDEIRSNKKVMLVFTCLCIFMCLDFVNIIHGLEESGEKWSLSIVDVYMYLAGGNKKYVPMGTEKFILPIRWMLIYLLIFWGVISFTSKDSMKIQNVVMLRIGSRVRWYLQRMAAAVCNIFVCFLILWSIIFLTCLIAGFSIDLQVNIEFVERFYGVEQNYIIKNGVIAIVIPFFTILILTIMVFAMLVFFKSYLVYGFLGILLLVSAYYCKFFIIGNLLIPLRLGEDEIVKNISWIWMEVVVLVSISLGLMVKKIKRNDLI